MISARMLPNPFAWLNQKICGIRRGGHDDVFDFSEPGKTRLKCRECGRESPGWKQTGPPPKKRFEGDRTRHAISKAP